LPVSLVIDREGRELGRAVGPAEWDGDAAIEFLRHAIAEKGNGNGRTD
jgi:hypothetical protein